MHDRLHELETDVRDLPVPPAATIRARGNSRRRRRRVTVATAAVAVAAATAGITLAWPQQQRQLPTAIAPADRPATPGLTCDLTLPSDPPQVRVRVLDGGASPTRMATTAAQLEARRFTVLDGTTGPRPATPATVVYGPAAIGTAAVLRAVVYGDATMRFDPTRPAGDKTIDLILGPAFTRLATTTEMNENLATAGEPTAPPECANR
ncbi:LytR C-terminal domain-containing protein [Actinoplanes sp. NPDC048796]|uniref:LytR C-terminal domain-containing protein n=1 Tax=Actinoplanes sp. NPDC048796 TaxID=3155640 RepID=UPI0033F09C5C